MASDQSPSWGYAGRWSLLVRTIQARILVGANVASLYLPTGLILCLSARFLACDTGAILAYAAAFSSRDLLGQCLWNSTYLNTRRILN